MTDTAPLLKVLARLVAAEHAMEGARRHLVKLLEAGPEPVRRPRGRPRKDGTMTGSPRVPRPNGATTPVNGTHA